MEFARAFLRVISKAERAVTLLAFVIMTLVIIADVFSRKLTGVGIAGAPRIGVFAMIATAFVSFGLASDARRHLRPKFADSWFPERWNGALTCAQELLTAAFCLAFAVVGVGVVMETYALGETTRMLRIPVWPMQAIIPLVFFIAAIRHSIFGLIPDLRPTLEDAASLDAVPSSLTAGDSVAGDKA